MPIPPLYSIRTVAVNISFVKIFAWHWRKIHFICSLLAPHTIPYAMGPVALCFSFKRTLICYISHCYIEPYYILTRGPCAFPPSHQIICETSCCSELHNGYCFIFYDGNTNRDYKWVASCQILLAWIMTQFENVSF